MSKLENLISGQAEKTFKPKNKFLNFFPSLGVSSFSISLKSSGTEFHQAHFSANGIQREFKLKVFPGETYVIRMDAHESAKDPGVWVIGEDE